MKNPASIPDAYDSFFLAGKQSPGVCRFTGLPVVEEGWKKQEPKGKDGGELDRSGRPLIEFAVSIYLWDEPSIGLDHFAAWDDFLEVILTPIAKSSQKALDIYHPLLERLGIGSVVVKSWGQPVPDGKGGATASIAFIQYAPPKKTATGKPKGSKSGGGEGEGPDPNQDVKDEAKKALEDFNNV